MFRNLGTVLASYTTSATATLLHICMVYVYVGTLTRRALMNICGYLDLSDVVEPINDSHGPCLYAMAPLPESNRSFLILNLSVMHYDVILSPG